MYNRLLGNVDAQGNPITDGKGVNWLGPVMGGLGIGAIASRMPKDTLAPDTSGIDIANIRSRALTGSDPGLHFLPPASATTAYAKGGRTGYATGDKVKLNMFKAFSNYKNAGGKEDFNGWFSNVWLPETTMGVAAPTTDDPLYTPTPDWRKKPWDITEPETVLVAQGGRIGYDDGGNYEAKIKELIDKG